MNKKLLMSTALMTVLFSGAALSAAHEKGGTKITGGASYSYSFLTGKTAAGSSQGYGNEVQLDILNTGDLNVGGLKYKAGFSAERDAGGAVDFGEGVFFSVVSGKTEVMFGIDKAPNLSQSATPRVGTNLSTQTNAMRTTAEALDGYDYSPGALAKDSASVAFIQGTDIGQISLVYAPKRGDTGSDNDSIAERTETGGSVMDLVYSGNLGVKGLRAVAGYSKVDKSTGQAEDLKATQLGVGYNFGQIAAGVTRNDTTFDDRDEVTSNEFGVTFAVNDNLSLGVLYAETENNKANTVDEDITSVGMAYNLGGAALELYYIQIENAGGIRTNPDVEKATIKVSAKF